jgi:hypothetical protein
MANHEYKIIDRGERKVGKGGGGKPWARRFTFTIDGFATHYYSSTPFALQCRIKEIRAGVLNPGGLVIDTWGDNAKHEAGNESARQAIEQMLAQISDNRARKQAREDVAVYLFLKRGKLAERDDVPLPKIFQRDDAQA